MLSEKVNNILSMAVQEAQIRRHEYISVEHVLFAILKDEEGNKIVHNCGADVSNLRNKLEYFFNTKLDRVEAQKEYVLQQTLAFQRMMQRAIMNIQKEKRNQLAISDVLISMLNEQDSDAHYFLLSEGIQKDAVINYANSNKDKEKPQDDEVPLKNYIEAYTIDLIKKASLGKIDNLIGRNEEIERIVRILSRRRKNNPVLIGEVGVGKTAIVEGIALKLYKGELYSPFEIQNFYALNLSALIAGTRMRGDFEQRVNRLFKVLEEKKNVVLFIDEIHTLVGTGATSGSSMDITNILKPILNEGQIRIIGATSYGDLKLFEKDKAFARRFEKVEIKEPSIDESVVILNGLKHYYEKHHKIRYTDEIIKSAVELSSKYLNESFLPDKAIDVLDELGSFVNYSKKEKAIELLDIEKIISTMAKVPVESIGKSDKKLLQNLQKNLESYIFGQDKSIESLVNAIKRAKTGIANYEKPIASFLFSGPTGVGKTELAKQLSKSLNINFIRFDMSEYMEKHSVSRFIGSPPGYVGFEQGGILTDKIRKNPHSVVLFDEIEKAHQDVYNILLQIMDYGSLTDNMGKKADFRNAIIIMSSNIGARDMIRNNIGFINEDGKDIEKKSVKAAERIFSPEFRNRIDEHIVFNSLNLDIMMKITNKFIDEIINNSKNKKLILEVSDNVKKFLAKKALDEKSGARPLKRLVQSEIQNKLADIIIANELDNEIKVLVSLTKKDTIDFKVS